MREELELHAIWSLPPTLILFTLLVSDRSLRARFEADVAGILIGFGLSSPKHLIGLSERHCPVMPRIPVDAEVADDIRHPFWSKWLEGAIPQLDNFGTRATRLPDRETISDADWNWLVTRAKNAIREKAAVIETKEPKARKPPQTKLAPQRVFISSTRASPSVDRLGLRHSSATTVRRTNSRTRRRTPRS